MQSMQTARTRSWLRAAAAVTAMLACGLVQAATVQTGTCARVDGSLIHWSLTPPLHAAPDARSPRGVLLVAQGSGCHPASASASVASAHAVALQVLQALRDALAPVASARLAQQAYRDAGHGGLTYWELSGHDHFMVDAHGIDQRDRVLGRVATRVADRLAERARTGADDDAVDGSAVGSTMPDADLLRWHRSMRRLQPWG
ncbi:hypothetical protein O4H66_24595 [Comamonadaceae bacterium G21597-S1]|nr:hypothetical protein [Comamonadaceae bacterium G21597-S1]